jgi:hypothetical protein
VLDVQISSHPHFCTEGGPDNSLDQVPDILHADILNSTRYTLSDNCLIVRQLVVDAIRSLGAVPSLDSGSCRATQRGPGLWDEVCSPKIQWWSLLALADLYVIISLTTIVILQIAAAAGRENDETSRDLAYDP